MTVRLLAALGQYPANAIVTFATVVETSLVAEKLASTDLTGGVVYQAPVDAGRAGEAARWVTDADGNPVDLLLPGAAGRGGAAAVVGAARIATPLVISVAGDSFAQRHGTQVEPLQRGDVTWLIGMSDGSLRWGGNIGVGGHNTSEFLAVLRSNTAWRSSDVLYAPIGINDLSSSSELPLATTLSNLREFYSLVRDAGVKLCHPLLPPVDTATQTTYAARYADLPVINQFICEHARDNAWMISPDMFAATVDPASATYAPRSGITADGIHVSNTGAYTRALVALDEFRRAGWIHSYMRAGRVASNLDSRAVSANCNQLITNPMLVGTSGSAPTGWTGSVLTGSPTVTLSNVTAPSGARGIRIQATTGGSSAQYVLISPTMHSYVAAGDVLETCVDVDVTDNTNAWFNWRLRPTIGGSTTSIDSMFSDAAGPAAVEPTLTPNIRTTLTGTPTNLTAQFFIQMLASASVDIVISLPECRKA